MLRYQRDGFSVDAAIAKGRPLPDWYLDQPEIAPGDDFYLRAFNNLGTCRQIGMSVGPIPWDRCIDYAERAGLEPDLIDAFVSVIRAMDAAYLDWLDKQPKRKDG